MDVKTVLARVYDNNETIRTSVDVEALANAAEAEFGKSTEVGREAGALVRGLNTDQVQAHFKNWFRDATPNSAGDVLRQSQQGGRPAGHSGAEMGSEVQMRDDLARALRMNIQIADVSLNPTSSVPDNHDGFLLPLRITLDAKEVAAANKKFPLNPIAEESTVFVRKFGADVGNSQIFWQDPDTGEWETLLREQGRTPLAYRNDQGLPGGRDFSTSESYGGSLTQKEDGSVESLAENQRHEASEELGLDPSEVAKLNLDIIANGMAISPDRSAGGVALVTVISDGPIEIDNDKVAAATSGETAEKGALVHRESVAAAIAMIKDGNVIDGKTAVLLLAGAYNQQMPLPASLKGLASPSQAPLLADRAGVPDTVPSNVNLLPATDSHWPPAERWDAEPMRIVSAGFQLEAADGSTEVDKFMHKAAVFPDQVNEMPVVTGPDGEFYVGLVPTVSAGALARETELLQDKIANPDGNETSAIQMRGILREVTDYAKGSGATAGNLGVMPTYDANDAYGAMNDMGLSVSDGAAENLGQFNASVGENAFHLNLLTREFALAEDATIEGVNKNSGIQLLKLDEAIEYAQQNPDKVDLSTQLQLYLVALQRGEGFTFEAAAAS